MLASAYLCVLGGKNELNRRDVLKLLNHQDTKTPRKTWGHIFGQKKETLQSGVRQHVEPGSAVYTDKLMSYEGLDADFIHAMVDHSVKYVEGRCHTNGLENFWSLLKRALTGTCVAVSPWHLFRHLDAQIFRFNERKGGDGERFREVMRNIVGKRLTYQTLTGAEVAVS